MRPPMMHEARRVTADVDLLGAWAPIPGDGVLAVNAFVLHAREPVLVDTGLACLRSEFMSALERAIDPAALRWIWITHTDADHVGNLEAVLQRAPQARVVTGSPGLPGPGPGWRPIARERMLLLEPGQRLPVGDRELLAVAPPVCDGPGTIGLFDAHEDVLFSADCFGAVLPAPVAEAAQVGSVVLQHGIEAWTSLHAPWLGRLDRAAVAGALEATRRLSATTVLGSHLPPARAMTGRLLQGIADAAEAPLFAGFDPKVLDRLFAIALPLAA